MYIYNIKNNEREKRITKKMYECEMTKSKVKEYYCIFFICLHELY